MPSRIIVTKFLTAMGFTHSSQWAMLCSRGHLRHPSCILAPIILCAGKLDDIIKLACIENVRGRYSWVRDVRVRRCIAWPTVNCEVHGCKNSIKKYAIQTLEPTLKVSHLTEHSFNVQFMASLLKVCVVPYRSFAAIAYFTVIRVSTDADR